MKTFDELFNEIIEEYRQEKLCIIETKLEDMEVSKNIQQNILLLHEIEFKYSEIKRDLQKFNEKFAFNVSIRFLLLAKEIFDKSSTEILKVLNWWKKAHRPPLQKTWAKNQLNQILNFYNWDDEKIKQGINYAGIKIDKNIIKSECISDEGFINQSKLLKKINNFYNKIITNDRYFKMVSNIINQIDIANEKIINCNTNNIQISELIKFEPEDLSTFVKKVYKLINDMTFAISYPLNILHTSGNILQDYGAEKSKNF